MGPIYFLNHSVTHHQSQPTVGREGSYDAEHLVAFAVAVHLLPPLLKKRKKRKRRRKKKKPLDHTRRFLQLPPPRVPPCSFVVPQKKLICLQARGPEKFLSIAALKTRSVASQAKSAPYGFTNHRMHDGICTHKHTRHTYTNIDPHVHTQ
jgi:hypothetical protein